MPSGIFNGFLDTDLVGSATWPTEGPPADTPEGPTPPASTAPPTAGPTADPNLSSVL